MCPRPPGPFWREKYADLPEWFETLKEASGICTLWVDSLREEGYEITRDFPFGVDKEAFHDFGSLIGIEPKVKAYLVGVPLTDLISSKLDEDFF